MDSDELTVFSPYQVAQDVPLSNISKSIKSNFISSYCVTYTVKTIRHMIISRYKSYAH